MSKVQVFDPPMCCSTGVCGPSVDPALVRFAADLEWLKQHGVEVERFNPSQDPAAFVGNPVVSQAIRARDDALRKTSGRLARRLPSTRPRRCERISPGPRSRPSPGS